MKKSQPSPINSTVDRHDIYVGAAQLKQVRVPPTTTLASAYKHFDSMSFKKKTTLEFNSTASSSDEKSPRTIEFYLGDKLIFSPATLNYRANKNNPPQQSSYVISVTEIRNASMQRYPFYLMYIPCDKQNYEQAWVHFPKATIDFMLQPHCMSFLRQQLESSPLLPKFETRNGSNHRTKIDNLLKALSSNAPQRKSRPVHYFKQWWIIYNNCVNRFFNKSGTPLQPNLPATPPKIKAPKKGITQGRPSSKSDQPSIDFDRINYQLISNNTLVKDGNEFRAAEIFQHKTQFHIVISYLNEINDEFEGLPLPGREGDYWAYHDLRQGRQRISHQDIIKRAVSSLDKVRIYFTDRERDNKLVRIHFQSSKKHTPPKRRINSPSAAASNKKQKQNRTGKKASPSAFLYEDSSLSAPQNSLLPQPDTSSASSNSNPFEVNHCLALVYCYSQHLRSPSFQISHLKAMTASLNEWLTISRPQHYPCIQQQVLALTNQISTALTNTESTPLATRMHLSLFRARLLTHLPKTGTPAPHN